MILKSNIHVHEINIVWGKWVHHKSWSHLISTNMDWNHKVINPISFPIQKRFGDTLTYFHHVEFPSFFMRTSIKNPCEAMLKTACTVQHINSNFRIFSKRKIDNFVINLNSAIFIGSEWGKRLRAKKFWLGIVDQSTHEIWPSGSIRMHLTRRTIWKSYLIWIAFFSLSLMQCEEINLNVFETTSNEWWSRIIVECFSSGRKINTHSMETGTQTFWTV